MSLEPIATHFVIWILGRFRLQSKKFSIGYGSTCFFSVLEPVNFSSVLVPDTRAYAHAVY